MNTKKIAGAALNQTPIDWSNNFDNIKNAIEQAKSENVDLLLLPELCITGYGCEDLFLSTWIYEKALSVLNNIVLLTSDIIVCVGLPLHYNGFNYNSVCVIHNKKIVGFSLKQFLANDGVHYETRWFKAWPQNQISKISNSLGEFEMGDLVYNLNGISFAFEICEDAWHENDRPAIRHFNKGVKLLLNPSASHFSFGKTKLREDKVVLSASEKFNCVYLYANLLGNEAGRIVYDGEIIIASKGNLIAKNQRLSFRNYNLVSSTIDFDSLSPISSVTNPDFYDKNEEFVAAEALCLFDYMRKSKSKGFVLSLSGGADSSCSAVLVSEMVKRGVNELGIHQFIKKANITDLFHDVENITYKDIVNKILTCVYQWAANSSWDTFDSAKGLAEDINSSFLSWRIDKEVASYTSTLEVSLQRKLTWETDDITLQNIQARSRAPIVWMLTNVKNALLITTSNRSEGDVGYATMDGDTCGSIAPIAGVEKYFIQQWLLWAETNLGYQGLRFVNALIPTAELRPADKSQTDEKDLMPYYILAKIEREAILYWKSPLQVYESLKDSINISNIELKNHIVKFFKMWSRNQWKRERIAPSFLLDDFNVDPRTWCRFPILSGSFLDELELLNTKNI